MKRAAALPFCARLGLLLACALTSSCGGGGGSKPDAGALRMIWASLAAAGPESARSAELLVAGQRTVIARGLAGEARAQAPSLAAGT
ncbi:MAG: hypothetical protein K8H99_10530, partial [Nitrospirae bacterium]|nr:hypothetical protein [Fimbriimonadaceae bacterium]